MNVGKAAAEIARLERALGIGSDGLKYLSITKANARIAELEKQLAARSSQAAPKVATPASLAAKAPAPQFTRSECLDIMRAVFEESPMVFASLSDSDLLADTFARCQAASLELPGLPPVEQLALGNHARIFRGQRQHRLDQLLKSWGIVKTADAPKTPAMRPTINPAPLPALSAASKPGTGLTGIARIRAAAKADLDAAGYVPKH